MDDEYIIDASNYHIDGPAFVGYYQIVGERKNNSYIITNEEFEEWLNNDNKEI